jgi:D-lactate dehydrogenase
MLKSKYRLDKRGETMKKIIFFDVRDNEIEQLTELCEGKYEISLFSEMLDEKTEITPEMASAEVISVFTFSRVSANVLKKFPNLKLVALRCVGFNHVDLEYCKEHKIAVANSFGYGNITVAEFAFGLIMDVMRKIARSYMNLKNEHLDRDTYTGFELRGRNIGIIGTGAIGAEVIKIAKGFGMSIFAYDLYPKQDLVENYQVKYVELDELLKISDIISLHAPLTENNFHLIDEEKINLMKPNAVLINTARGELIDTKALYKALSENKIFGAGLDVLEAENLLTKPDINWDFDYLQDDVVKQTLVNERLLKLHNVVVTPHIAYNTQDANDRILHITIDNINSYFNGELKNSVIR